MNPKRYKNNLTPTSHLIGFTFGTTDIFTFTFTFIHLADAFIQSDLQMRVKLTIGQQYVGAVTLPV